MELGDSKESPFVVLDRLDFASQNLSLSYSDACRDQFRIISNVLHRKILACLIPTHVGICSMMSQISEPAATCPYKHTPVYLEIP